MSANRIPAERLGSSSAFVNAQTAATEQFSYPFKDNFSLTSGFKRDAEEIIKPGDSVVLFAGDSHMQHYWSRIELASRTLGSTRMKWRLLTAGGHPMLPGVNRIDAGYRCDRFFDFIIEEAKRPEVSRLVLSCAWQVYFMGPFQQGSDPDIDVSAIYRTTDPTKSTLTASTIDTVFMDLQSIIRELVSLNKEVSVILPSPSTNLWNPRRVARWQPGLLFTPEKMTIDRRDIELYVQPLKAKLIGAVISGGGRVIDPYDYFEEAGKFVGLERDGQFRYKDHHHFRAFYVAQRASFIDDLFSLAQ